MINECERKDLRMSGTRGVLVLFGVVVVLIGALFWIDQANMTGSAVEEISVHQDLPRASLFSAFEGEGVKIIIIFIIALIALIALIELSRKKPRHRYVKGKRYVFKYLDQDHSKLSRDVDVKHHSVSASNRKSDVSLSRLKNKDHSKEADRLLAKYKKSSKKGSKEKKAVKRSSKSSKKIISKASKKTKKNSRSRRK